MEGQGGGSCDISDGKKGRLPAIAASSNLDLWNGDSIGMHEDEIINKVLWPLYVYVVFI